MEEQEMEAVQAQEQTAAPAPETPEQPTGRAFAQEVRQLLDARPELRGEELPEAVIRACMDGASVTEAYNAYAREQRRQDRVRRQNEAAAAKAPIRGVTRGGGTNTKPDDPFLQGFRTQW